MATAVAPADVELLKHTQILVSVEEALADMLVVSYISHHNNRRFQGVLLDSTKRNLPFGVKTLNPALQRGLGNTTGSDDKLYSTSQRFAYQETQYSTRPLAPTSGKAKNNNHKNKMTVRLRPRKVLCSNCMGICNDNTENVADSRTGKRKNGGATLAKEKKVYLNADPRSSRKYQEEEDNTGSLVMTNSLIPKISRLHPNEINNAINGSSSNSNVYSRNEIWLHDSDSERFHDREDTGGCDTDTSNGKKKGKAQGNNGRQNADSPTGGKKKNRNDFILPDVVEDNISGVFSSARTLKISYGEGEGAVKMKIPTNNIGEYVQGDHQDRIQNGKEGSRAARKAHKKSKKQSRRQASCSPSSHSNDADYQAFPKKHKKVKVNKKKKGVYKEEDSILPTTLDPLNRDPLATDPLATTNPTVTPLSPQPIDVIS